MSSKYESLMSDWQEARAALLDMNQAPCKRLFWRLMDELGMGTYSSADVSSKVNSSFREVYAWSERDLEYSNASYTILMFCRDILWLFKKCLEKSKEDALRVMFLALTYMRSCLCDDSYYEPREILRLSLLEPVP